jgi:hypothetical protein
MYLYSAIHHAMVDLCPPFVPFSLHLLFSYSFYTHNSFLHQEEITFIVYLGFYRSDLPDVLRKVESTSLNLHP